METKQKTTLIQGSVAKGMLLFALPIFISNLFQQLYNAADSLIVGNFLGGEALAAPRFEEALAETGVQENDRVTVTPARIKKLESRSFKTESGIEIRIPAELCSSDDAVEFIHSATGGLSLLIKDVLV